MASSVIRKKKGGGYLKRALGKNKGLQVPRRAFQAQRTRCEMRFVFGDWPLVWWLL